MKAAMLIINPDRGFALPSIMIASVVMLLLLVTAISSVTTTRTALDDQYRNTLTRQAAESGVRLAEACVRNNDMTVTWSNSSPLRPNTDCSGNAVTGQSAYVLESGNFRTSFTVGVDSTAGGVYTMNVEGLLEQTRTSSGAVWRTSQQVLKAEVSGEPLFTTSVSSGLWQVCAVLSEETWCNGGNNTGQMGNGRQEPLPPGEGSALYLRPERVIRLTGGLLGKQDKIVSSGQGRACTVTTDDSIYCWGSSGYGSLGAGYSPPNPQTTPIAVAKPAGMTGEVTAIAQGWNSMCAISGGDLWCWGRNNYGQLGINNTTNQISPVRVHNIGTHAGRPVTDVASHPYSESFCAAAGGDAYCWGRNTYGQLGDNSTTTRLTPVAVRKDSGRLAGKTVIKVVNVTSIRAHDSQISLADGTGDGCTTANRNCYVQSYSCALTSDGQMYCWGANRFGQMGQGSWTTTNQLVPIRVMGALNGKFVRDIAGSYMTPCALTTEPDTSDRLYCWGRNASGAGGLGHGNACDNTPARQSLCSPSPVVMQTPGLANRYIDSISAGVNRMCAITQGVSYCTGLNTHAQLGDGTTTTRYTPTEASVFRQYRPSLVY